MSLNGLYVAAWVVLILAAVRYIPRAVAADRLWVVLQNMGDEELTAYLDEHPDVLDWRGWR